MAVTGLPPATVEHDVKRPMIMPLTSDTLIWLINEHLRSVGAELIPEQANLSVDVPSGGDCSGERLHLDNKIVLNVRFFQ
jgi:hypothetical protein